MRTISTSKLNAPTTATTSFAPSATATVTSLSTTSQHSPWHSPVPYLFGGLAAMLGLIAFALLILACSYWKLSGHMQNEGGGNRDSEKEEGDPAKKETVKFYEEKILVIMAGDEKPTFLATPAVCAMSSSFALGIGEDSEKHLGNHENCDKSEKEIMDNNHIEAPTAQENEDIQETQQDHQSQ